MKDRIRNALRRLFFYSSRQLWRRRRTYLSVFFTSVFLLALVMCAIELFHSYLINRQEIYAHGNWHACFLDSPNDLTEKIAEDSGVRDAWAIPWTSRLASSEDASSPGKVVVPDEEINERLGIRYLWGHAPEDGEIAVSRQFFEAFGWLEAGEECELFFKAAEMTYFPLRLSGIFQSNDADMQYVFVSKNTARKIDRETGAHEKYDLYFTVTYLSDRFAAKIVDRLFRSLRIAPTDEQAPKQTNFDSVRRLVMIYEQYLNADVKSRNTLNMGLFDMDAGATPTTLFALPVIAVAALILASFMSHWTAANAPEFGVLGAIGATRRNLCSIAAGQVLLLSLLSAPPVILFSALLSNWYISAYNAATLGTGLVFFFPWTDFVKISLWFAVLSCVFTYFGIARMTLEQPYILMTGSYRGEMPFVRTSSLVLSKIKNKVARLALIETMRQIRGDVVQIVVTGIVSVVVVVFAAALGAFLYIRNTSTSNVTSGIPTDTRIATLTRYDYGSGRFAQASPIPEKTVDKLRATPGIVLCGTLTEYSQYTSTWNYLGDNRLQENAPCIRTDGQWSLTSVMIADEVTLPFLYQTVFDGDPDALFDSDDAVLFIADNEENLARYAVGTTLSFGPETMEDKGVNSPVGETCEFTVRATLSQRIGILTHGGWFILSRKGAERLGICPSDECRQVYLNFDPDLSEEERTALLDKLTADPDLLRYRITNVSAKNSSEQAISRASMTLVGVFCLILYVSFAVMSVTHVKMKTAQARRDISIKRQLGADDRAIYREARIGSYPASAIALGLILGLALLCAVLYILTQMSALNIQRDRFPFAYPPEVYNEYRSMVFLSAGAMILLSLLSSPILFFLAATAAAGTVPPTRAVLREPITEGLRKGTD